MGRPFGHRPVLVDEVLEYLQPSAGKTYLDCTVGGGGHAEALFEAAGGSIRLVGLDQDPAAIEAAGIRLQRFADRVTLVRANFDQLDDALERLGIAAVDGILFDLGVSSYQLDTGERGFSYFQDAPLDMRMDPRMPRTAADLVREADEDELARILREYGEERWAARIARFIVARREKRPVETTGELVEIVKAAIPAAARREGGHPARRTFQALRIAVNDELGSLERALGQAVGRLGSGGRLVVISFHSLEDRIVKRYFAEEARGCDCPPDFPVCRCGKEPRLRVLTRKPISPRGWERQENPRARSAKLRAAERVLVEGDLE